MDGKIFQLGGQSGQQAFTGAEAKDIVKRLQELPAAVHEHPGGLTVELASYDTIPLPIPSPEQQEDRELVLRDCARQKQQLLKAIADLDLALGPTTSSLFENSPAGQDLLTDQAAYREALNALMAHAIKIATGEIQPPTEFVAKPPPPDLGFLKLAPFAKTTAQAFLGEWHPAAGQRSRWTKITIFPQGESSATVEATTDGTDATMSPPSVTGGGEVTPPGTTEGEVTFTGITATLATGAMAFEIAILPVQGPMTVTFSLMKTDAVTLRATIKKIFTATAEALDTEVSTWNHAA